MFIKEQRLDGKKKVEKKLFPSLGSREKKIMNEWMKEGKQREKEREKKKTGNLTRIFLLYFSYSWSVRTNSQGADGFFLLPYPIDKQPHTIQPYL